MSGLTLKYRSFTKIFEDEFKCKILYGVNGSSKQIFVCERDNKKYFVKIFTLCDHNVNYIERESIKAAICEQVTAKFVQKLIIF